MFIEQWTMPFQYIMKAIHIYTPTYDVILYLYYCTFTKLWKNVIIAIMNNFIVYVSTYIGVRTIWATKHLDGITYVLKYIST